MPDRPVREIRDNAGLPFAFQGVGFLGNSGPFMNQAIHSELLRREEDIARICASLGVRRLEIFGSAAADTGKPPDDLDFLVDLGELPPREYADAYFKLRDALGKLFDLPVDLITPANLGNPYFRQRVEQEKTLLYAA